MSVTALSDRWTSIIISTWLRRKCCKRSSQGSRTRLQSCFVFKTNSWHLFIFLTRLVEVPYYVRANIFLFIYVNSTGSSRRKQNGWGGKGVELLGGGEPNVKFAGWRVYKSWFCKLLEKCIKYPRNGSLVGKNLPHLGNKADNILVLASALSVLTCSTTALRKVQGPKFRKMDVLVNTL